MIKFNNKLGVKHEWALLPSWRALLREGQTSTDTYLQCLYKIKLLACKRFPSMALGRHTQYPNQMLNLKCWTRHYGRYRDIKALTKINAPQEISGRMNAQGFWSICYPQVWSYMCQWTLHILAQERLFISWLWIVNKSCSNCIYEQLFYYANKHGLFSCHIQNHRFFAYAWWEKNEYNKLSASITLSSNNELHHDSTNKQDVNFLPPSLSRHSPLFIKA